MKYLNKSQSKKNFKLILNIAIPMIIANLSIPLLGLVDTAIVGRINIEQIGSVAIGSTILSFIYFCFGFFRMGTTGLTAQAWGQNNLKKIENIFIQNFVLAIIISALLILILFFFKDIILLLFTNNDLITLHTKQYLTIRIFEAPARFINLIIIGLLLGCNKPWQTFKLIILVNSINIVLDIYLGIFLNLQIKGIALGTLISEYICLIYGFSIIKKEFPNFTFYKKQLNIKINNYKTIFYSNLNLFIRTALILISIVMFTAIGSRLGQLTLAANAILISIQMFISYGLDGFAQAAEVLVGNNYKKSKKYNLINVILITGIISFLSATIISIILLLYGAYLIPFISPIDEVINETNKYILWIALSPLVSFLSFHLDGVFIGANLSKIMRNSVIISFIIYLICLYIFIPTYNNNGLWLAFMTFMLFRGILLLINIKKVLNIKKL